MSSLPVISSRECIKALQKAGFEIDSQRGSHVILVRDDPSPARTVSVPQHKEIKPGTLRSIIKQAGLEVEEFIALL